MDPFLESAKKQFRQYKLLGEKAMEQLSAEQLFIQHNENSNSIAVIVKHMAGNMVSRWTDFLYTDGEKPWRNRDEEFEEMAADKTALLQQWEKGWTCLFDAIEQLDTKDLSAAVYIRNEKHSVIEAVTRQLCHYSYHVGQIVFYAKLLKEGEWNSLSIPKNRPRRS
jgi:uncharacterized damage-inducible protein DinB